jgi:hypothetical protein
MFGKRGAIAALTIALIAMPAMAQERTAVRKDFDPASLHGKTILLLRPTVKVGAQSTGGMFEPNGDWTEQARGNIDAALGRLQTKLGNRIVPAPDAYGEPARLAEEYAALFAAVSQSVIRYQFFAGNRLPTKKHDNRTDIFDWSLGPGVADLPGAKDADYALFLFDKDAYGSTGRKLLQVAAALTLAPGVAVKSGEHAGYAGLVDLRSGDLVWLNADTAMGGDVRTVEGADKRVAQLLEGFPGSAPEPAAAARP